MRVVITLNSREEIGYQFLVCLQCFLIFFTFTNFHGSRIGHDNITSHDIQFSAMQTHASTFH